MGKNKGGRPTQYKEEFLTSYAELAEKECSINGADDKKLAEYFNVTETTINNWKIAHPEFFKSIKKGKEDFDTNKVEKSLLKRALGYEAIETHKEKCNAPGCSGTKTKTITKHIISDTAILFWLKNRWPERWRDIKAMELTGKDGGAIETKQIDTVLVFEKEEDVEYFDKLAEMMAGTGL
jgi:hypothetical protein